MKLDEDDETDSVGVLAWPFDTLALEHDSGGKSFLTITNQIVRLHKPLFGLGLAADTQQLFQLGADTYNTLGRTNIHYHTSIHGADVCQAFHWLLCGPPAVFAELRAHMESPKVVLAACIIAAAMHDYGHPGLTAQFLIQTHDSIATESGNDLSCLEYFHASRTIRLMESSGLVLPLLSQDDERLLRRVITELILSTSMAKHGSLLAKPLEESNYLQCLKAGLHCADLSNAGRPPSICQKWTSRLMEEFHAQGDLERELGFAVTPYMDRNCPDLKRVQLNFFQTVTRPLFIHYRSFCPEIAIWLEFLKQNEAVYS